LVGLPLKAGRNELEFRCGDNATVAASLWLWEAHTTLVISDIDGTISVSDVRGYINTVHLKRYEHTHAGVCRLYSHLAAAHDVRFLYLTSRPLSLLPATRAYLAGAVQDGGHRLPPGPIICSPYGLVKVLWKELIEKTIRQFKQQALLDVADVFQRAGRPLAQPVFAAGFGNKTQDALAYMGAGVPSDAIFIINVRSEVRLHAHMEAAAAQEKEQEEEDEQEEHGRRTPRSRLQGWLGGTSALNVTAARGPPSPEREQETAAAETEEERAPVAAVERITMVRGGSMDGAEAAALLAGAAATGPPSPSSSASFPPFSSYGDERLLLILEDVLAREAPCHEPQPPAPPAAPVGDTASS
jgi:phosphatidate phosphatase LPIN